MTTTIATPRRLRSLLALSAATALLLTGCGDDGDEGAAAPDGGQRPGIEQRDDASPSVAPSTSSPAGEPTGTSSEDPSDDPSADHSPADVDLTDFPLAAGWPKETTEPEYGGLELPVKELDYPFADSTCGSSAPMPTGTFDDLRGQFSDVEAYLSRELLVFPDADTAVAYVSALSGFYDGCPAADADADDPELTSRLRQFDTDAGGQSFAVVQSSEAEGEAQVGMAALQVTRVGRSVLLDTTAGEGLINDAKDARALADSMTDRAGDVVAAQCVFTDAGC